MLSPIFLGNSSTVSLYSRKFFDGFGVFALFTLFSRFFFDGFEQLAAAAFFIFSEILRRFNHFLGNSSMVLPISSNFFRHFCIFSEILRLFWHNLSIQKIFWIIFQFFFSVFLRQSYHFLESHSTVLMFFSEIIRHYYPFSVILRYFTFFINHLKWRLWGFISHV